MKKVSMSGSLRENVGKKDAKKHRREGNIPCVLYGGEKQVYFVIDEIKFDKIIAKGADLKAFTKRQAYV